jgi:hypothetical protein
MRQLGSNEMDGVNGLTECPIAPGETRLYRFKATQYGTTVSAHTQELLARKDSNCRSGIIHITLSSTVMVSGEL